MLLQLGFIQLQHFDNFVYMGGRISESAALRPSSFDRLLLSILEMIGGPSGFHNAPVTRTFVMASALLTGIFGLRGRSLSLRLPYQDILKNLRLWRIIISQFAFSSTPELMFGLYLVYYFRLFERQIGSNKYSMFVLFSSIASSIFEVLALAILKDSMLSVLASGPYSLIFASFVPFYFDIPVSSRFRIFGLHFSDKSFVYLAGFQLLLSSWKRTLVPGICGVLVGFLYRFNAFGVRRIKFPGFVTSFFAWLSWSSASSSQSSLSSRRNRNGTRRLPSYGGRGVERIYPSASRVDVQEPPESSVDMLVSMGFDSSSARQALVQARNDINVATNILLESQPR